VRASSDGYRRGRWRLVRSTRPSGPRVRDLKRKGSLWLRSHPLLTPSTERECRGSARLRRSVAAEGKNEHSTLVRAAHSVLAMLVNPSTQRRRAAKSGIAGACSRTRGSRQREAGG